jgi:hypothetical protein
MIRRYQLSCRRCGATCDADGDRELYFRHGMPATAPWSISCPTCGGLRVAVLPFRAQPPRLHTDGRSDKEVRPRDRPRQPHLSVI